ncbi:MAG: VOC family protein [Acidobacteria bacterium]|nr:VOC family protein [Acidobacteriota bacterium]
MNATLETPVEWAGLNHLALITNDMDLTVRFWHGVLDAQLVATIGNEYFRHYFFDVGSSTVAFFEYRGRNVETLAKPAGVFDARAGHFDHLSLNLPSHDSLAELRERLRAADCGVTSFVDHGLMESIYFNDPNGIALEASYWLANPTDQPPQHDNTALFGDPDPVGAVAEIAAGALVDLPTTSLVNEPTVIA